MFIKTFLKKNIFVLCNFFQLIDHLSGNEPGVTEELSSILNALTALNKNENVKVALRARQVCNIDNKLSFFLICLLFI